jgi:acyl-CoA synthetase (AMP-forming)/AMP-acid ligase II/acyl carrier protein
MSTNLISDYSQFSTVVELFRYRAKYQPDDTACIFLADGETREFKLSYQQWDQEARTLATWFQRQAPAGDRALLLYPSGLDALRALLGCWYAGLVPLLVPPPQPNRPMTSLQAIAADAKPTLALTTTQILSNCKNDFDQIPELKCLRWLPTDNLRSDVSAEDLREPVLSGETLACLVYTSGSTGKPKGVMVGHNNLLSEVVMVAERSKQPQSGTTVLWAPLYSIAGLFTGVVFPLWTGLPLVLMPPSSFVEHPARWLQAITRYKGVLSAAPDFAYQMCVDRIAPAERAMLDLSSWVIAVSAGEPVRLSTIEQFAATFATYGFRRAAWAPSFGLSETSCAVCTVKNSTGPAFIRAQRSALNVNRVVLADSQDNAAPQFVSNGPPLTGQNVIIVDPTSWTQCPPDRVGEIWVSGSNVARGYWNMPEETEKTFHVYLADSGKGPFLRTGDLGFFIDNELYVTGRLKEMIIIHGRNYHCQDVEQAAAKSHPALQSSGGAAFALTIGEEERLAIVHEVKKDYPDLNADEVISAIRRAVAGELEQSVYVVALVRAGSLPRTGSGKIQRYLVRTRLESGELEALQVSRLSEKQSVATEGKLGYVAPRTPIERALVGIWSGVLQIAQIGVNDNFFELGGDSIKATQIISQVKDVFQVELDQRAPFDAPTIANLAAEIVKARQQSR